jgi:UPF0755 protein
MNNKKKILLILMIPMMIGLAVAIYFMNAVYGKNIIIEGGEDIITIQENSTYLDVKQLLTDKGYLKSEFSFDLIAKLMKYEDGKIKDGKYLLKDGWTNRDIIGVLRLGTQVPMNVTYNNVRTIEELAGKIEEYFSSDSADIINHFLSPATLDAVGLNKENLITLFIPNTYQMYWNTKPAGIIDRAQKEYNSFWNNNNRKEKARQLGLSKEEIYTLASIVEKESNNKSERPRIAGVYLNRLNRGIPLQADPTVVFATGLFDLKRVLNVHLEYDSPYNTYKYPGLPPGPICMPSVNSIDAVINAENHDYLYFCAKPGYESEHLFAKTLRQHNVNANIYRRWLSSEGIK